MRDLINDDERRVAGDEIAKLAAHIDKATHQLLGLLVAFDRDHGWALDGAQSFAHWLSWRVGWDLGTAREHLRVARVLAELPAMTEAFAKGEVSYSKVRAMTRVATAANERGLLELAGMATAAQLDRICAAYARSKQWNGTDPERLAERRIVTKQVTDDGLVRLQITLTADEADRVCAAIDKAARETSAADSRGSVNKVDGVVALAESFLAGKNSGRSPTEVSVIVPAGALRE